MYNLCDYTVPFGCQEIMLCLQDIIVMPFIIPNFVPKCAEKC